MGRGKELEIIYRFSECKECPLARVFTENATSGDPWASVKGDNKPVRIKFQMNCLVVEEAVREGMAYVAHMGGMAMYSYHEIPKPKEEKGKEVFVTDYTQKGVGEAPEFCPEVKHKK